VGELRIKNNKKDTTIDEIAQQEIYAKFMLV
jgi:hypothetical protein